MIRLRVYDFRCRHSSDGIMETILDHGIEIASRWRALIVVGAALRINVSNLLPYTALTCTNGTDALKEFSEIVFTEHGSTLLEPIVVKCKSLCDIFLQHQRCPLAKLRGFDGINTVADGDNSIEIIECCLIFFPISGS